MRNIQPHKERGQALILIVLAIVGLIGLTALAVDGGNAYAERRRAQNAADASALDAALAKVRNENLYSEGLARAASNSFNDGDASAATTNTLVNVEIYNPPSTGAYNCANRPADCNDFIQVIITATVPTYFGRVVGISQITNQVQAVARAKPGTPPSMLTGNAIVGLSPECKAIMAQGNGGTAVTGGGLYANGVDCTHDNALFNNSNSSWVQADCFSAVGGIDSNGGFSTNDGSNCFLEYGNVSPLPQIVYPNPICTGDAAVSGSTMTPGNWPPAGHAGSSKFPPSGVNHLDPGIYCIDSNQGVDIQGDLSGSEVLIVVNGGNVSINANANVTLSAPTSGPYDGLLFYVPPSNPASVTINGNSDLHTTGMILAPTSAVTINGGSTSQFNFSSQIVGFEVKLTGNSGINLHYNSGDQFQLQVYPQVELMQ